MIISRLQNSPLLDWLVFLLLVLVLLADRYTVPGFAHGVLYTPILVLSGIGNRLRRLTITFTFCLLFVWSGVLIMPAGMEAILQSQFVANRILATLALITIFFLSRFTISSQQQQTKNQQQLKLAAEIAKLGYWQWDKTGFLQLSPEAAQLLEQKKSQPVYAKTICFLVLGETAGCLDSGIKSHITKPTAP